MPHTGSTAGPELSATEVTVPAGSGARPLRRRRSEFVTTLTDEMAMAPAARPGFSSVPVNG